MSLSLALLDVRGTRFILPRRLQTTPTDCQGYYAKEEGIRTARPRLPRNTSWVNRWNKSNGPPDEQHFAGHTRNASCKVLPCVHQPEA
ncbi:jg20990 [Pararge aegeria aegeria]|uniref:Jg20990 protein n=1 Tax=Pararge aegeria aegeria TaxID=348720 RepID=A0A8S4R704_9NEOP|nr:jg20990 [Pararge aegeria aegeria]